MLLAAIFYREQIVSLYSPQSINISDEHIKRIARNAISDEHIKRIARNAISDEHIQEIARNAISDEHIQEIALEAAKNVFGQFNVRTTPSTNLRYWSMLDGRKIEISLHSADYQKVSLLSVDKKLFTFPVQRFSSSDQEIIKQYLRSKQEFENFKPKKPISNASLK